MDRREFLKVLGAVSLIPLLPSLSLADTPKDLKQWFENNFDCQYGWPGPTMIEDSTESKHRYQTFAAGVLNTTEDNAKRQLTQYFINQFTPFAGAKAWWRVEPQFTQDEVYEWGKTWMTAEEVEDSPDKVVSQIVGISPGVAEIKNVPYGVKYDFETGSYKYVTGINTLYRMRFRLAIPELHEQLQSFAKVEGEKMENI